MVDIGDIRIEIAKYLNQINIDLNENRNLLKVSKHKNKRERQALLTQDDRLEEFLRNKLEEANAYTRYINNLFSNLRISIPEVEIISINNNISIEEANQKLINKIDELDSKYRRLNILAEKLQQKRKQWWKFW